MNNKELTELNNKTFEDIKRIDEDGNEFWYARELMITLGYKDWRYFDKVIEKSQLSCQNSGVSENDHFVVNNKMVEAGVANKFIKDYILSRYACYLIAQNANPRLKAVALAQTYFAVQTRRQELTREEYNQLSEDEKRLYTRKNVKDKNKFLFDTAKNSGVTNYEKFLSWCSRGESNPRSLV